MSLFLSRMLMLCNMHVFEAGLKKYRIRMAPLEDARANTLASPLDLSMFALTQSISLSKYLLANFRGIVKSLSSPAENEPCHGPAAGAAGPVAPGTRYRPASRDVKVVSRNFR